MVSLVVSRSIGVVEGSAELVKDAGGSLLGRLVVLAGTSTVSVAFTVVLPPPADKVVMVNV